jgi:hypothetical protein
LRWGSLRWLLDEAGKKEMERGGGSRRPRDKKKGGRLFQRHVEERRGLAEAPTRARRRRAARCAVTGEGEGEAGRWTGPRGGAHPSAKRGEREREWQVGPAAIQLNSK